MKGRSDDAFRFPQGFKLQGNQVYLPKIGWLRFKKSRDIEGLVKNVTVSRQAGHWYVAFQTELDTGDVPLRHPATSMVGVDVGIAHFATLSTGQPIAAIHAFKQLQDKLKHAQRSLARTQKGSRNREAQKLKVQRLHRRIRNIRHDFLHKCSTQLSKNHAVIVLEDLKIANMIRSAQGSLEQPGVNVKAKAGLNRAISDQAWGEWVRQLQYKQAWLGGEVLKVPAHYTSQRCPNCDTVSRDNRRSQSVFRCIQCNLSGHADVIAATNILRAGHVLLACGDISANRLRAQEPLTATALN